jgi:L-ribulose-5-phosphate 3-epimerase
MDDAGTGNLGVCFDPANLLAYGKANPIDALDLLGKRVEAAHAKDATYPASGNEFGVEKPIGEGQVNIPLYISKLKALGYGGAITIERETEGEAQIADIRQAISLLDPLL